MFKVFEYKIVVYLLIHLWVFFNCSILNNFCDPYLSAPNSSLPVHRSDDNVPPAAHLPQNGRPAWAHGFLPIATL